MPTTNQRLCLHPDKQGGVFALLPLMLPPSCRWCCRTHNVGCDRSNLEAGSTADRDGLYARQGNLRSGADEQRDRGQRSPRTSSLTRMPDPPHQRRRRKRQRQQSVRQQTSQNSKPRQRPKQRRRRRRRRRQQSSSQQTSQTVIFTLAV